MSESSVEPIDQRTGEPYVGKDFGHGLQCTCLPCIKSVTSDMIEAGILSFAGVDKEGALLLELKNEPGTTERDQGLL